MSRNVKNWKLPVYEMNEVESSNPAGPCGYSPSASGRPTFSPGTAGRRELPIPAPSF